MIKYQCYWHKVVHIGMRKYIGAKVLDKVFDTEDEAERYCNTHVEFQGDEEREIKYEEIEV